jgi:TRAP-type mannitol/chloroaromatic compound transport system substrate-binding protein
VQVEEESRMEQVHARKFLAKSKRPDVPPVCSRATSTATAAAAAATTATTATTATATAANYCSGRWLSGFGHGFDNLEGADPLVD